MASLTLSDYWRVFFGATPDETVADATLRFLSSGIGGYAPSASPTFTGTLTGANGVFNRVAVNASAWSTVERVRFSTPTTPDVLANVMIASTATTAKPLVVQGIASQTAMLVDFQSSAGASLASVAAGGTVTAGAVISSGTVIGSSVQAGTTPASAGVIRIPNNVIMRARNAANTADVDIAQVSAANIVQIGGTGATAITLVVGAQEIARCSATALQVNSTGAPGAVEKFRVNAPTTVGATVNTYLSANSATAIPVAVQVAASQTALSFAIQSSAGANLVSVTNGGFINCNGGLGVTDGTNVVFGATTGTKLGTATTEKLSFWNKTPIIQPTAGIAAAAFVSNTSLIANDTATFGGYTLGQIAAALINVGLLA